MTETRSIDWQLLASPLLDPTHRLFWPFLLSSLALAVGAWIWEGRLARSGPKALGLLTFLFPREVWLHRSALLDYQLLLFKQVTRLFMVVPWGLTTFAATAWVVRRLHNTFGTPQAPHVEPWLLTLLYTTVLFLVWDLSRYVLHRMLHKIPLLWQFHQVHHSAEVLTPVTFYRTHPVESFLYWLRGILATALVAGPFFWLFRGQEQMWQILGVHAVGFGFNVLGGNLRHSHIWFSWGSRLEQWFISPAQHQLHHSRDPAHFNCNFGSWLAIWDQISGGLILAGPKRDLDFGLNQANHKPDRLWDVLLGPLIGTGQLVSASLRRGGGQLGLISVLLLVPAHLLSSTSSAIAGEEKTENEEEEEEEEEADNEETTGEQPEKTKKREEEPKPIPPQLRETISVLGKREGPPRVAGSAHSVQQETLELFEHNDIHKVLAPVPGVYIREEDGFGLRPNIGLRGASSDRSSKVTLMEDGILLAPAPYSAPAAYYFPMSTRMVGVEVFKGAAAIRHGPNTIGGAVNMQTRPVPPGPDANLEIALGSHQTEKVHAHGGTRTPWGGVLLEGIHLASDGFKQVDGGSGAGFVKHEVMFKGRLNTPLDRPTLSAWELKLGYARERSNETYLGLSDGDFQATPTRRYAASQLGLMKWSRTQIELAWQLQAGANFELRAVGYHHGFKRAWRKVSGFAGGPSLRDILDHPDAGQSAVYFAILRGEEDSLSPNQTLQMGTNDRRYQSYGGTATASWRARFRQLESHLEVGIRLHGDQVSRHHSEEGFLMQQGAMVSSGISPTTTVENLGRAFAFAGHVHEELSIGPFTAVPGLRLEVIETSLDNLLADQQSQTTRAILLPGLGLHIQARPWLSFLAGIHRGFSPAAPGQDPQVQPEESWNVEAGARLAWRGTRGEVVGFFNNYSNLTGTCTLSAGCAEDLIDQQFNAGKVYVYGLEALFEQRFELPAALQLRVGGSYTWTGSAFQSDFTSASAMFGSVHRGDKLSYVPEHQGSAHVTMVSPVSSFELALSVQGPMRDLPGQGEIPEELLIPEHATLELAADLQVLPHLSLYATVNNLTNASYMTSKRPYGARGTRPIHAMFGLKVAAAPGRTNLSEVIQEAIRSGN